MWGLVQRPCPAVWLVSPFQAGYELTWRRTKRLLGNAVISAALDGKSETMDEMTALYRNTININGWL